MPGTFSGIEIASRALRVNQEAVEITGHNLANVNTPGYSRQTVSLAATEPYTLPDGDSPIGAMQVGTGVEITAINRARDEFVERQLLSGESEQGQLNQLRDLLQRVQGAYNEPGEGGISSLLTSFFNSFQELSRNAESSTARALVRQQARALSHQFNQVYQELGNINHDLSARASGVVAQVNGIAREVAALNAEIKRSLSAGYQPNDLADRRDTLIRQISGLVGATAVNETDSSGKPTGAVNVVVNGFGLVTADQITPLPDGFTSLNGVPQVTDGRDMYPITGGTLGGLLRGGALIAGYQADLDTAASALITRVNAQHEAGFGLDGGTGRAFFSGTGAADIALSAEISTNLDAIAAATPPQPGSTVAPGNGDNALALANLSTTALFGASTLGQFYASRVAQVGSDAQAYEQQADNQSQVMQQLEALRSAASGVSVDEEMTRMIQYQRAYQAAARMLTTMDSLLETMINAMGR